MAAGRARQAEMRLVVAEMRRAVVGERTRSCGWKSRGRQRTNPGKSHDCRTFRSS